MLTLRFYFIGGVDVALRFVDTRTLQSRKKTVYPKSGLGKSLLQHQAMNIRLSIVVKFQKALFQFIGLRLERLLLTKYTHQTQSVILPFTDQTSLTNLFRSTRLLLYLNLTLPRATHSSFPFFNNLSISH